jgi:DNA-binding NarL/FixJ family response regulator
MTIRSLRAPSRSVPPGYIPKSTSRDVMVSALRLVCSGGMYLPPKCWLQPSWAGVIAAHRAREPGARFDAGRQIEQANFPASSAWPRRPVKNHVTAILKALGASNRTEAVIAAGRLGWKPGSNPGR